MAKTKKNWKASQEKEALLNEMKDLRQKANDLEEQKKIQYDLIERTLEKEDLSDERIQNKLKFLREQVADLRQQIEDATKRHNEAVDRYKTLEEAGSEKGRWIWTAVEVLGGIGLGVGGLALSHRDTLNGRIKNKDEDSFFQAAWKKLFK